MKTIGLIGGMSWESTVPYYRIINQYVVKKLGGLHSAKILLYSVDFDEIERCQVENDWEKSAEILGQAAQRLEGAGVDGLVICTNTMHKVFEQIQEQVHIPILHIADATAEALTDAGIHRAALLGTLYTMTQDFCRGRLEQCGLEVIIPEMPQMQEIHRVIFEELCRGQIREMSRLYFREVITHLQAQGAQGVILGCTEIGLLVRPEDAEIPVFDTTVIHATKAAEWALSGDAV